MKPIDLDAVEKAVAAAEAKTSAEIIVAINRQSGSYVDREVMYSVLAGLLAAETMILVPWWEFDPMWFLPDAMALGLLVFVLIRFVLPFRRAAAGKKRMDAQVRLHSRNAFLALNVSATRERTGLLLYLSLFEDRVLVLPDFGIEGRIPSSRWEEMLEKAGPLSAQAEPTAWFCRLVESCGALLATKLPPGAQNPDELSNRPRLDVE